MRSESKLPYGYDPKIHEEYNSSYSQSNSGITQGIRRLFKDELKSIYWSESVLFKIVPKMYKEATSNKLKDALTYRYSETTEQLKRLEEVFAAIGLLPETKKCDIITGLINEVKKLIHDTKKGIVRDAGIISIGHKIEFFEISGYNILNSFAILLKEEKASYFLRKTIEEKKAAARILSKIAKSLINAESAKLEAN